MKAKVRLNYSVELFVEGVNEDAIMDWLMNTTPLEAKRCAEKYGNIVTENYDEEIICEVAEISEVDYVI